MYHFSERSLKNLRGVHEDLQKVAHRAIKTSPYDFMIIQGLRTKEEQARNVKNGVSWTNNSRHLTGHAVDIVPLDVQGKPDFKDLKKYKAIRDVFFRAANELEIPLRWGGDWSGNGDYHDEIQRGVYDGGHFELPRKFYPVGKSPVKQMATSKRVGFASLGVTATVATAADTLHEFAGFKAALSGLFGNVPEWFWLALILIAFAGVIWTKWHDGD